MARDTSDPEIRVAAIKALSTSAKSTIPGLTTFLNDTNEFVRLVLLRTLVPEHLSGSTLVQFLLDSTGDYIRHELAEVAHRISSVDLDTTLQALNPVLSNFGDAQKSQRAFDVAVPLILARLAQADIAKPIALESLLVVEQLHSRHLELHVWDTEIQALNQLFSSNSELRKALWMFRFRQAERNSAAFSGLTFPPWAPLEADDINWLWTLLNEPNLSRVVRPTVGRLWDTLPTLTQLRVLEGSLPAEAREYFAERLRLQEQATRERDATIAESKRVAISQKEENSRILLEQRDAIVTGDDVRLLVWAWHHLAGNSSDFTKFSPERLAKHVDEVGVETVLLGLRALWRKCRVGLRIPGEGSSTELEAALTGLTIDVGAGLEWGSLSADDASRAAMLAMHNLNAFPFWFPDLIRPHGAIVHRVLVEQLKLEWNSNAETHGVFGFASRCDAEVAEEVMPIVRDLLGSSAPGHPETLRYAVDAYLSWATRDPGVLRRVTSEFRKPGIELPNVHWLRAWAHLEPEGAAGWIERMARTRNRDSQFSDYIFSTISRLEEDLNGQFGRTVHSNILAPQALKRWCTLLLAIVKRSEDIRHEGAYSPDNRDHAQDLRNRLLTRLGTNPTVEARNILEGMLTDPALQQDRDLIRRLLTHQHQVAVDHHMAVWTEEDIIRLERSDEKRPRTSTELYSLVKAHLQHVQGLLENSDFSYRNLFSKSTKEREIQLWVASCLQERARGLYSVVRENVVDDDKEVDISAFAPGVGQIPIEIKPLGPYSATKLENVLETQLINQYMLPLERQHGILLLVRRDKLTWHCRGKKWSLKDLRSYLHDYARQLASPRGKEVSVEVIDLLATPNVEIGRGRSAPQKHKQRARRSEKAHPKNRRRRVAKGG